MNYIDIVILVPIIWGGYIGFKKGLIIEVVSLLALGFGIWGGIHFSNFIGDFLSDKLDSAYVPLAAFGLTFILIVMVVYFIGKALEKVINLVQLKLVNKLAGVLFGMGKVALIISILIMIVNSYDQNNMFIPEKLKNNSLLYEPFGQIPLKIIPAIEESEIYKKKVLKE